MISRRGQFLPLSDGQDECAGVIVVLETSDTTGDATATIDPDAALHDQLRELRREMAGRYQVDSLLGNSPAIRRVRTQIEVAGQCRAHVLVCGPRGSGKDHAARAIHYAQREPGALVPVDCGLLEVNLLRSALRAAWSPAVTVRDASVTLLLNDVDRLPPEAQSDLGELVAGNSRRVRVIVTSCRPLAEAVAAQAFSQELACALATMTIELPPLCERLEDLPLLAQAFLEEGNPNSTKQVGGFRARHSIGWRRLPGRPTLTNWPPWCGRRTSTPPAAKSRCATCPNRFNGRPRPALILRVPTRKLSWRNSWGGSNAS